jgi:hypothetical protein
MPVMPTTWVAEIASWREAWAKVNETLSQNQNIFVKPHNKIAGGVA